VEPHPVLHACTAAAPTTAKTKTAKSGCRSAAIGVNHGPGNAGKPHSHAALAWPSSWIHMLRKIRISMCVKGIDAVRKAPARATGIAQVLTLVSRLASAVSHSLGTASTAGAVRVSALA
jgi:hypothetical protein